EVVQHLELVAAALDRVDDRGARRVHLDVAAGRGHRDFFVREVVRVEAGAAGAFRRVDAVIEHAVLVADAEALVAGLLALVAAAYVEAGHAHAGRLAEDGPDVGRRRYADQLVRRKVRADLRVLD